MVIITCQEHGDIITNFINIKIILFYTKSPILFGIINIPQEVELFSCIGCKNVTGFTGYANYMYFTSVLIPNIGRLLGCVKLML